MNNFFTIKEIREGLADRRLTVVARETGLHYNTVRRIAAGECKDCTHRVAMKLASYLNRESTNNGRFN